MEEPSEEQIEYVVIPLKVEPNIGLIVEDVTSPTERLMLGPESIIPVISII